MSGTSGERQIFTWEESAAAWTEQGGLIIPDYTDLKDFFIHLGEEVEVSAGKLLLHHLRHLDADTFFLVLQ